MAVPAVALIDDSATATGTAFVALVFLGAAIVGLERSWHRLLFAAGAVSVPQLIVLVFDEGEPARAGALAVAAAFGLLYLGLGVARQLRAEGSAARLARGHVRRRERRPDAARELHPPRRRRPWNRCRGGRDRLRGCGGDSVAPRAGAVRTRLCRRLGASGGRAGAIPRRPGARRRVGRRDGSARLARPPRCRLALPAACARLSRAGARLHARGRGRAWTCSSSGPATTSPPCRPCSRSPSGRRRTG